MSRDLAYAPGASITDCIVGRHGHILPWSAGWVFVFDLRFVEPLKSHRKRLPELLTEQQLAHPRGGEYWRRRYLSIGGTSQNDGHVDGYCVPSSHIETLCEWLDVPLIRSVKDRCRRVFDKWVGTIPLGGVDRIQQWNLLQRRSGVGTVVKVYKPSKAIDYVRRAEELIVRLFDLKMPKRATIVYPRSREVRFQHWFYDVSLGWEKEEIISRHAKEYQQAARDYFSKGYVTWIVHDPTHRFHVGRMSSTLQRVVSATGYATDFIPILIPSID